MATLSPCIDPRKVKKNGLTGLRIRISHNHQTAYIVTPYSIKPEEFKNGRVVKRDDAQFLNNKLNELINTYLDRLSAVQDLSVPASTLRLILEQKRDFANRNMTIQAVIEEYSKVCAKKGRDKDYISSIERHCRRLTDYVSEEFPIGLLTPEIMENFKEILDNDKSINSTTVGRILSNIKVIVRYAANKGYAEYKRDVFSNVEISQTPRKDSFVGIDTVRKVISLPLTKKNQVVARDLFLLIIYLGGINITDLMRIDLSGERMEYIRNKTKGKAPTKVSIVITQYAKEIIAKYIKADGRLDFGYKYTDEKDLSRYLCRTFKKIEEVHPLKQHPTMYGARKTFSQFAFELGHNDPVVDYCLGHAGDGDVLDYYRVATPKMADKAVKDVAEYINTKC